MYTDYLPWVALIATLLIVGVRITTPAEDGIVNAQRSQAIQSNNLIMGILLAIAGGSLTIMLFQTASAASNDDTKNPNGTISQQAVGNGNNDQNRVSDPYAGLTDEAFVNQFRTKIIAAGQGQLNAKSVYYLTMDRSLSNANQHIVTVVYKNAKGCQGAARAIITYTVAATRYSETNQVFTTTTHRIMLRVTAQPRC